MNNIAQSNPEGELERLSGARKVQGAEEPARDGVVEHEKVERKKKWPLVVLILVVLAVVGGGVAWWVLARPDMVVYMDEGDDGDTEDLEDLEDGPVELDMDDELVRKLYNQISGNMNYGSREYRALWLELAKTGVVSDEYMKYVALQNVGMRQCEVTGREIKVGNFTLVQMPDESTCVSGNAVRQKVKEIFGREVAFVQDEEVVWKNYVMYYDVENDEFWGNATDGGGYPAAFDHILYRAERDAERIYIYELMGSRCVAYVYRGDESVSCLDEFPGTTGGDALATELRWFKIDEEGEESWLGENIPEMTSTEFRGLSDYFKDSETWDEGWEKFREQNKQNMLRHADLLSRYKWTLEKNVEGNYVFKKLEKIK